MRYEVIVHPIVEEYESEWQWSSEQFIYFQNGTVNIEKTLYITVWNHVYP